MKDVFIKSWGSISPLGLSKKEVLNYYRSSQHALSFGEDWKGSIDLASNAIAKGFSLNGAVQLDKLDRSVLLSLFASKEAMKDDVALNANFGVNIGSSRGATEVFEKAVLQFEQDGKVSPLTSPITTLGNLSSWVAQEIGAEGIRFSQSVTCSTGLQSVLNGVAYMKAGMADGFLAGATEAPLTAFTIGQMKALKIYAPSENTVYPNRSLDLKKTRNSFVLGEGAASFNLSTTEGSFKILGWGFGNETIKNATHISPNGKAMQDAMKMALANAKLNSVDAVVCHAPGTIAGDGAELNALQEVFGNNRPAVTGNKWKLGHALAASGALSLEMALLMLQENEFFSIPFLDEKEPSKLDTIMVNAAGFGGNSASLIISRT